MAETLFQLLSEFFARYGYWAVFFGVMLENAGLPVPGETILIFAGFLAYHGELHIARAIGTAILGATVGDSLGYCLGRFGGASLVDRYRKYFPFISRRYDQAQTFFLKHGQWAVFTGRFITGLRMFAGPLAGIFRMRYPRFLFFNFSGAVGWATTFGCVGFILGSSWEGLVRFVQRLNRVVLAAVAAGVLLAGIVYLVRRRRQGGTGAT